MSGSAIKLSVAVPTESSKEEKDEQYMSSKQWLAVYGIDARKLNLYDILSGVAFKHQDGVVEILEMPTNEQTDAVSTVHFFFFCMFAFNEIVHQFFNDENCVCDHFSFPCHMSATFCLQRLT